MVKIGKKVSYFKDLPSTGEWINIEVGQQLEGSEMIYSIFIGGKKVFSTTNSKPAEFENVHVFASSRWYSPVSGFIKNLLIQNKNNGRSILDFIFIMLSLKILKAVAYLIGHLHSPFRENSFSKGTPFSQPSPPSPKSGESCSNSSHKATTTEA